MPNYYIMECKLLDGIRLLRLPAGQTQIKMSFTEEMGWKAATRREAEAEVCRCTGLAKNYTSCTYGYEEQLVSVRSICLFIIKKIILEMK